jgi:hypothetical protein
MPTPVHAHVRVENEVAAERHQQVLAARSNRLEGTADDRMVFGDASECRKGRLESNDRVAVERAMQSARSAKDRVTFGHAVKSS